MVIKKCKICGEPFDAKGRALCCSPECSKENRKATRDRYNKSPEGKAARDRYNKSPEGKAARDRYNKSPKGKAARDRYKKSPKGKATWQKYEQSPKGKTTRQKYYNENKDEIIKKDMLCKKDKISELCKEYEGDLEQILENIPTNWHVREAKMQVWFGESYADGMIAKIKMTPVCEVTGEKTNDLVIHHLWSFNMHPELGNDPANMVRITKDVHNEFHKIFGYGNNTPEQWNEFVENFNKEGGDSI